MLCLGIESSCDDTSLALVRDGHLEDMIISSQVDVHALFGGIVPELASREHARLCGYLYDSLLLRNGYTLSDIDGISVARGPGLLGSLLVGISFAKGLSFGSDKPLIGVNHLYSHVLAAGLECELVFPALALLVSGGHTILYLVEGVEKFELLGRSLDDAAGEAFDKFGKMIGLPYPAGRFVDEFGAGVEVDKKLFTVPYIDNDNLDFSFSGLKTAALQRCRASGLSFGYDLSTGLPVLPEGEAGEELRRLCASFSYAVVEALRIKVERAFERLGDRGIQSLILAGGVACNSVVRRVMSELASERGCEFRVPSPLLCTDNAGMIAYTGSLLLEQGYRHGLDFAAIPRGQLVPVDYRRAIWSFSS